MSGKSPVTERNLAMDAVRITEQAARAASQLMGHGDERAVDEAAMKAMEEAMTALPIAGTVRVGEATSNGVSGLSVGARVGSGDGPEMDVALMPLEGPTIVAKGEPNAISVIAMTDDGGFLHVPDCYMDKIAVGAGLPDDVVDLDETPSNNLKQLAKARGVDVSELVVCILDRPRHSQMVAQVRQAGARIMLIGDGDVSGVMATTWPESGVDIYMGIGGAPQGVLAAAALRCSGGRMQGRLAFRNDGERKEAGKANRGFDLDKKYTLDEMASGDVTFVATGVTNGTMLRGVRTRHGVTITQSLVMRSRTGTVRYVEAHHKFADGRAR